MHVTQCSFKQVNLSFETLLLILLDLCPKNAPLDEKFDLNKSMCFDDSPVISFRSSRFNHLSLTV